MVESGEDPKEEVEKECYSVKEPIHWTQRVE
jgi:hypothetical protein